MGESLHIPPTALPDGYLDSYVIDGITIARYKLSNRRAITLRPDSGIYLDRNALKLHCFTCDVTWKDLFARTCWSCGEYRHLPQPPADSLYDLNSYILDPE